MKRIIIIGCLALLALGGCGTATPTASPTTSAVPSLTSTTLTSAETAQEAFRLLVAESEPGYQTEACSYFAADAIRIDTDGPAVTTVPMSKWCGPHPEKLWPASWEERDQTPVIEEEQRRDAERWVQVVIDVRRYYVAAVVETSDGWRIVRWCRWSSYPPAVPFEGSGDPFYCLAQTGDQP